MKGIPGKESRQNMGRKEPELSPKDMCLCPRAPGAWTTAEVSCTVEHWKVPSQNSPCGEVSVQSTIRPQEKMWLQQAKGSKCQGFMFGDPWVDHSPPLSTLSATGLRRNVASRDFVSSCWMLSCSPWVLCQFGNQNTLNMHADLEAIKHILPKIGRRSKKHWKRAQWNLRGLWSC